MNNDLTKRWYIEWYFFNESTNKWKRFREYGRVKRLATIKARKAELIQLRDARNILLEAGYNPFKKILPDSSVFEDYGVRPPLSLLIDKICEYNENKFTRSTCISQNSSLNIFKEWIGKHHNGIKVNDLKQYHIIEFLDKHILKEKGLRPRTRNNYLIYIKALFSKLNELGIYNENPARYIKKIPEPSERNEPFTEGELLALTNRLKKKDPQLHLFSKFIMYSFMRIEEIAKIQLSQIDLDRKIIHIRAQDTKNNTSMDKIIVAPLFVALEELNLKKRRKDLYLFHTHGKSTQIHLGDTPGSRYTYSRRFSKHRDALGIPKTKSIYTFRHTGATQIYNSLRDKRFTREEAVLKMMPITGHKSAKSLDAYIRSIKTDLPEDYSDLYSNLI